MMLYMMSYVYVELELHPQVAGTVPQDLSGLAGRYLLLSDHSSQLWAVDIWPNAWGIIMSRS
jgi:hypothetical protein